MAGAQRYEAEADLSALVEHPQNPRSGDDEAVAESIEVNGFYGAIVAQESTSRVLVGHTRRRNLMDAGAKTGPVLWIDVDDERALRILLTDNRTAELAAWIPGKLSDVLSAMGADVTGTGFSAADVIVAVTQAADADALAALNRDYDPHRLGPALVLHAPAGLIAEFRALPGEHDADRLELLLAARREQAA
jgi:ParB-like chromosome segregation protein Spo0J